MLENLKRYQDINTYLSKPGQYQRLLQSSCSNYLINLKFFADFASSKYHVLYGSTHTNIKMNMLFSYGSNY